MEAADQSEATTARQELSGEQLLPELLTAEDIRTKMEQLVIEYGKESLELNPSSDALKGIVDRMNSLREKLQKVATPLETAIHDYNAAAINHADEAVLAEKAAEIEKLNKRIPLTQQEAIERYNAAAIAYGENDLRLAKYAAVADVAAGFENDTAEQKDPQKVALLEAAAREKAASEAVSAAKEAYGPDSEEYRNADEAYQEAQKQFDDAWQKQKSAAETEGAMAPDAPRSEFSEKARKLEESLDEWAGATRIKRAAQRARAAEREARKSEKAALQGLGDDTSVTEAEDEDLQVSNPETSSEISSVVEAGTEPEISLPSLNAEELQELLDRVLEVRKVVDEALERYYAAKDAEGADSKLSDAAYEEYVKIRAQYDSIFEEYIEPFEVYREGADDAYLAAIEWFGKDSEQTNEAYAKYLEAAALYSEMYKAAVVPGSDTPVESIEPQLAPQQLETEKSSISEGDELDIPEWMGGEQSAPESGESESSMDANQAFDSLPEGVVNDSESIEPQQNQDAVMDDEDLPEFLSPRRLSVADRIRAAEEAVQEVPVPTASEPIAPDNLTEEQVSEGLSRQEGEGGALAPEPSEALTEGESAQPESTLGRPTEDDLSRQEEAELERRRAGDASNLTERDNVWRSVDAYRRSLKPRE